MKKTNKPANKIKIFTIAAISLLVFSSPIKTYSQEFSVTQHNPQWPTVPLYTVEDFFGRQEIAVFTLMPHGEKLMFLAPVNDVLNIFTRDIATGEDTQITFEENMRVGVPFGVGDTNRGHSLFIKYCTSCNI